jgi:hypothetical protein
MVMDYVPEILAEYNVSFFLNDRGVKMFKNSNNEKSLSDLVAAPNNTTSLYSAASNPASSSVSTSNNVTNTSAGQQKNGNKKVVTLGDILTAEQKKALEEAEKNIAENFKTFSAY